MAADADPDGRLDASLSVDVQVACSEPDIPAEEAMQDWVKLALRHAQRENDHRGEVTVRIVDADEIRALNAQYCGIDKATNVLSFPAGTVAGLPEEAADVLGDIVICAAVVSAEAAEQGKRIADHWGHMLIHGTLHLVGFNHEDEVEASEMEGLEARILAEHGIADPYGPN